jgi:hypothetical protein
MGGGSTYEKPQRRRVLAQLNNFRIFFPFAVNMQNIYTRGVEK